MVVSRYSVALFSIIFTPVSDSSIALRGAKSNNNLSGMEKNGVGKNPGADGGGGVRRGGGILLPKKLDFGIAP